MTLHRDRLIVEAESENEARNDATMALVEDGSLWVVEDLGLATSHHIEAFVDESETWKIVCDCGWETWGHDSEDDAVRQHSLHREHSS